MAHYHTKTCSETFILTGDFLSDTFYLTTKEVGAYWLLLCACVQNEGSLPDDDSELARLTGLGRKSWKKMRRVLAKYFEFKDGRVFSPMLERWRWVERKQSRRPAIPSAIKAAVFKRDGEVCVYCGQTAGPFHLDHVVPWSRGGEHSVENLVVSCPSCNLSKKDKTLKEWLK